MTMNGNKSIRVGVFDIETNGLRLDDPSKQRIWCATLKVNDSPPHFYKFDTNQDYLLFTNDLQKCDIVVGHNILGFDIPYLKDLTNFKFKGIIIDTLVLSKLQNPDRDSHSLGSWAASVGTVQKIGHEDWHSYSESMKQRNITDVEINYNLLMYFMAYFGISFHNMPSFILMEMKFAEICQDISDNGIELDLKLCNELLISIYKSLEFIDEHLTANYPIQFIELPAIKLFKKGGAEYTIAAQAWIDSGRPYKEENNMLKRYKKIVPNWNSPVFIRNYLLSLGWAPKSEFSAWNHKKIKNKFGKLELYKDDRGFPIRTTPKLPRTEEDIESLKGTSANLKDLSMRMLLRHRCSTVEGLLRRVKSNGRISMKINSLGAATMRVTHSEVCNIPKINRPLGRELRSLFTVRPEMVMVGCDISNLEASIVAHFIGDNDFIKFIKDNDGKYHAYFYEILKDYVSDINQAKNVDFAFLYGAGDAKLGSLCDMKGGNHKVLGEKVRVIIEEKIPSLKVLQDRLIDEFRAHGTIKGLDGRLIQCRKQYALINTLCQSGGAIFAKAATCRAVKRLKQVFGPRYKDIKHVIFYHDENEFEVPKEIAGQVGEILIESIEWTSAYFDMKLPITGKVKFGKNWADVH